ncbi:MAG: PEGA domain-containing protein [Deltaproteobacteria bacterium]|nr:MAG: PEGA domain-containing protein [Deltaproteobacteria bacterium]
MPSIVPPRASGKLPQVKPRMPDEDTRQLESPAPANPLHDDTSGLLTTDGDKLWDDLGRLDPGDDLDGIGERTLITGAPGMPGIAAGGFMMDVAADGEQIEVTLVTSAPTGPDFAPEVAAVDSTAAPSDDDDDGPTLSRDFALDHPTKPARPKLRAEPPAALAANIHAPAVSELRRPRTSRRTPPGGSPPNVLQAIVGARAGAPMPAPRSIAPPTPPPSATHATVAMPPQPAMPGMPGMLAQPPQSTLQGMSPPVMMPQATTPPPMIPSGPQTPTDPYLAQFPVGTPGAQPSYNHDASGLPMGLPTPPGVTLPAAGMTVQPGVPYPPPFGYPHQLATEVSPHGYPQMSPGALYHFQPTPQPTSLTGQMRLLEVDEIPSQFKIGSAGRRWFTYVTFLIIRSTREPPPTMGSVHLESVPSGAEVIFDGTRLTDRTPLTIDGAPVGTRHTITIVLPHYAPHTETIDIPKNGREVSIIAQLASITGKIPVNTMPAGAEVRINGQVRGVTPTVINDVDIESTRTIELRHKDFPPHEVILKWTADGRAPVDYRFTH